MGHLLYDDICNAKEKRSATLVSTVIDIEPFECIPILRKYMSKASVDLRRQNQPQESQIFVSAALSPSWLVGFVLQVLCREVRRVGDWSKVRNKRGIYFPNGIPVHSIEE